MLITARYVICPPSPPPGHLTLNSPLSLHSRSRPTQRRSFDLQCPWHIPRHEYIGISDVDGSPSLSRPIQVCFDLNQYVLMLFDVFVCRFDMSACMPKPFMLTTRTARPFACTCGSAKLLCCFDLIWRAHAFDVDHTGLSGAQFAAQ